MIYYENNNGTRMDLDNWPVVIKDIIWERVEIFRNGKCKCK